MSDGYRDDGTGTEDWGVTRITDQMKAWPGLGCGPDPLADFGRKCQHGHLRHKCEVCEVLAERTAIEARLRTAAEALRDCYRELNEIHARDGLPYTSEGIKAGVSQEWFTAVVENARAVLAQLEKEGLA